MEGNSVEYGYNLATTYKPTNDINLAMTYRSNVNLKEEGDANLYIGNLGKQYSTDVTVPLPAALNLAVSKTWLDRYTLEFNYERTYWSKYKSLDFNYGSAINSSLIEPFDNPKAKNWKDTDTFRVGATIDMNSITYMLAYAKDETPIPKEYINYELPDSDGNILSMGIRVKVNDNLSWGLAYLHDEKDSTTLKAGENKNGIIGKFSGGGADLFTAGMSYEF
jgi:long-chain fatty acid transport protein